MSRRAPPLAGILALCIGALCTGAAALAITERPPEDPLPAPEVADIPSLEDLLDLRPPRDAGELFIEFRAPDLEVIIERIEPDAGEVLLTAEAPPADLHPPIILPFDRRFRPLRPHEARYRRGPPRHAC